MECDCWEHRRLGPKPDDPSLTRQQREAVDRLVEHVTKERRKQEMDNPVLRCKMRVSEVTQVKENDGSISQERVKLQAVYGAEGTDNAQWSKWTPNASFEIYINNPQAFGHLSSGHEYFVDFTPAAQRN